MVKELTHPKIHGPDDDRRVNSIYSYQQYSLEGHLWRNGLWPWGPRPRVEMEEYRFIAMANATGKMQKRRIKWMEGRNGGGGRLW